ncbi:putative transcriptional regulatory protein [Clavispora lusitaniae]|uniref:Transcriptional regulatory protein n=1 Tax=Clavispora lusitaniae TaxID=36911 RepID=A0ACD0WMF2_CLALS|nr:putative transcriptional regulatory protein [Clavispora lusitaniae]QFZ34187.1 putative transcriptional regulatory protein [Clavispora lusitaniae]QFZ39871.1 putative transcriptional regulatory protein [Clavispora lusitaniae]QFZ45553.1 putative transcriptional regulatory protein [Clavispora lusitaniae]QFZ51217.1 putative transcriptional regulatory protein [Clavispora lusitaniae]
MMDKSKMKSILPKPSPSMQTSSPLPSKRMSASNDIYSKRSRSIATSSPEIHGPISNMNDSSGLDENNTNAGGHATKQSRPVTSCTFCRQHKIKCNASDNYPNPCTRCSKMGLKCEIDPQFKPKKGSQIQTLIGDVEDLKAKIEMLSRNEHLLTQALNQHNMNFMQHAPSTSSVSPFHQSPNTRASIPVANRPPYSTHSTPNSVIGQFSGSTPPPSAVQPMAPSAAPGQNISPMYNIALGNTVNLNDATGSSQGVTSLSQIMKTQSSDNSPSGYCNDSKVATPEENTVQPHSEFILGDVRISLEKANELHERFMSNYLPFLPILDSRDANTLFSKSQLLFWTVMLTASLSEPEPTLYMSLSSLIKQLAIETCWIRTPRSTHVIQALIILSIWPLPNEKVLDDCSYRFVGLAKNLSLQLGLHRGGEFIQEFTRTQVSLGPDSELWRTRSWLAVFFCDQFWSSALGLPPSINTTDYLLENARIDASLPANFRCLISLAIFQCKLVNVMGISVTRSDGLLEPSNRAASLNILDRELERLKFKLNIMEDSSIEIYYLYLRLMICCFAFLPGTPIEDQVKYVSTAYFSSTRIITISSQLLSRHSISLMELPIYVRQAITYSALLLFRLHLSRYLIDKYVDSARQSIVTVHRLFRNTLSSWKDMQNDISRTAKVLENLNIVLYTYPEIFNPADIRTNGEGSIISRMRSHLTASLFYDLVWCIHEAKRRRSAEKDAGEAIENKDVRVKVEEDDSAMPLGKRFQPLPFYNQITKDDFKTITTTTPNGTTITTLVPTDQALNQAKLASANGTKKPLEINGIPLSMLEATGSTKDVQSSDPQPKVVQNSTVETREDDPNTLLSPDHIPKIDPSTEFSPHMPLSYDQTNMGGDGRLASMGNFPFNPTLSEGPAMADQLDNFFQQQSHGWLNNSHQDDDFLGWIDVNMLPEK